MIPHLAGARVGGEHHPVRRVEPGDHASAALPEHARQPPVDPHLGVVVDGGLEDERRASLDLRRSAVIAVGQPVRT